MLPKSWWAGTRTGIIGLKEALDEAQERCEGFSDEKTGNVLIEILSKRNYIPSGITGMYREAFLREYKKHIGEPVTTEGIQNLQIKVLGPGCPQCEKLEQEVMAAMVETGINGDLEHVRDLLKIGTYHGNQSVGSWLPQMPADGKSSQRGGG